MSGACHFFALIKDIDWVLKKLYLGLFLQGGLFE